jgi:hypothetical protein
MSGIGLVANEQEPVTIKIIPAALAGALLKGN